MGCLPTNCDLTSRIVIKSRLYAAPPARTATTKGRPRVRGERLPTPPAMLTSRCRHVTLEISGRRETSRLADQLAHVSAVPGRLLRVVAVEGVRGGRGQEAFFSTCTSATQRR